MWSLGLWGALGKQLFYSWGRMSGFRNGPEKKICSFSFVLQIMKIRLSPHPVTTLQVKLPFPVCNSRHYMFVPTLRDATIAEKWCVNGYGTVQNRCPQADALFRRHLVLCMAVASHVWGSQLLSRCRMKANQPDFWWFSFFSANISWGNLRAFFNDASLQGFLDPSLPPSFSCCRQKEAQAKWMLMAFTILSVCFFIIRRYHF